MWSPEAFQDEISKIATRLNESERRQKALMFTTLGALSGPAIGSVSNLIQHGKLGPASQVPLKRWIPATMASGALLSSAVPMLRRDIEEHMQHKARTRLGLPHE